MDGEIKATSERVKANAFVNDHLDRELELLDHESRQLDLLEGHFNQLCAVFASHNRTTPSIPSLVSDSIEQATYTLDQRTKHLTSLVTEMLELRSAHLFAQEDAQVPVSSAAPIDDFEAFSQSQQRQLLVAISGHPVDPYVEEWARCSAIASLEDIAVMTRIIDDRSPCYNFISRHYPRQCNVHQTCCASYQPGVANNKVSSRE